MLAYVQIMSFLIFFAVSIYALAAALQCILL